MRSLVRVPAILLLLAAAPSLAVSADAGATGASAQPSAKQTARFNAEFTRGRKLSAQKRWVDAIRAFEAALQLVPMSQQALTDLGWAAFNAGDRSKARKATRDALRAATFPDVRAAVLYNLGRISEADGDKAAAGTYYEQSLALRPNATVEERLKALRGGVPPTAWSPVLAAAPACATPMAPEKLCACLITEVLGTEEEPADQPCVLTKDARLPASFRLVTAKNRTELEALVYLVAVENKRAWAVAPIGHAFNPGAFGINEEFKIRKIRKGKAMDREYVWIEGRKERSDSDMGLDEIEFSTEDTVTVVFVDGKPPVLQFPTLSHYRREEMGLEPEPGEPPFDHPTKLPIQSTMDLDADLSPDGRLTIKLKKGKALGPKGLLGEFHVVP